MNEEVCMRSMAVKSPEIYKDAVIADLIDFYCSEEERAIIVSD